MTGKDIVKQARTWLGTPFHHQGRLKGVGVDCTGLIVMVLKELGYKEVEKYDIRNYPVKRSYPELKKVLKEKCIEIPFKDSVEGDLLLFVLTKDPQHLAIKSGEDKMIHAVRKFGAVEVTIDEMWLRRLDSVWRLKALED